MSKYRKDEGDLVIAPNTFLSRLIGNRRRSMVDDVLLGRDGRLPDSARRVWNHRVGGLVMYALGVRTSREMERTARSRRQSRNRR
ncbi:MAG: hypothetical protein SF029_07260 [bacterium]|nr:hypothetical protein [bacterium]